MVSGGSARAVSYESRVHVRQALPSSRSCSGVVAVVVTSCLDVMLHWRQLASNLEASRAVQGAVGSLRRFCTQRSQPPSNQASSQVKQVPTSLAGHVPIRGNWSFSQSVRSASSLTWRVHGLRIRPSLDPSTLSAGLRWMDSLLPIVSEQIWDTLTASSDCSAGEAK